MHLRNLLKTFALLGFISPLVAHGGSPADFGNCKTRPLSDFLDAQGTTSWFFPDVADMLAWTSPDDNPPPDLPEDCPPLKYFALVDYAGLANDYVEESETETSLGTRMTGRITECATDDGRTKISVVLNTRKALGFAQSVPALCNEGFDFLGTPTIFGVKAQDVEAGATPALGPASLRVTFYIENPGDPLPDIRLAFQENNPDVRPISLDFRSTTIGYLADGPKARMRVQQVGATDASGELVFSREIVDFSKKK